MELSYRAAVFFCCCFVAVCQGQLSLEALPDVLFVDNSGVHNVELGTVIRARCTASSSSAPVVTWFKDGSSLLNDPPHIRIRTSTDSTEVTSVLTIDNFITDDNGDYYCQASDSTTSMTSTTLSLTVIDDNSIHLLRDPVTREIVGGNFDAIKNYDRIRDNRTSYSPGANFEPNIYISLCCQVLRCEIAIPGDQTAAPDISFLSVAWLKNDEEVVHVAGQTEITNTLRYQSGSDETRYVTQLVLMSFETADAGIYQCVYSDYDSDRELLFSTPFRLDSDDAAVVLEAVSPVDIVLEVPEKLVLEVESSGGYARHAWYKNNEEIFPNGDTMFREDNPERFSEFFQVFVQDPTTASDHGIYRVDLIESDDTTAVAETQEFTVTPLITLSVSALNTTTVTVVEEEDVDISCRASANPVLTSAIVWTFDGNPTSFSQTDATENRTAYIPSAGTFSFYEGNVTSTLHITAAVYPTNDGIYTCSLTNDTVTLTDMITVEVQVPPELTISATSTRIALGQSTNIVCSVSRSVPSDYTIEWTLTNTNDGTTTLNETGDTLVVTDIAEDEFGTYKCTATNSADLSGSVTVTIEEGALPEVSIADVEAALPGDSVTLSCSATGDTPLTYQWTMEGSTDIINTDNSTGILTLTDITLADFGTYTCNVSNTLGNTESDVSLQQATTPTTSASQSVSVVEGETLELTVTVEFNLVLDNVIWTQGGMMLMSGTDRITIVNSDLDPPNATSTLTRTSIDRLSDGGTYVVNATNRAGSSTATFTVDVTYPPDVSVSATRTRLPVSESTTLNCSVASSNPSTFTVMWTLMNTNDVTMTLSETGQILVVSDIGEDDFGTYTCNVTNSANLSGTAELTIEQGAIPGVTVADVDVAIPGDNVILNCSATGDTPLTYQWTMQGSADVLNTDMSIGIFVLMGIQESLFGTYICSVSNALGVGASNVTIEQATAPVAGENESITFEVGVDLVLMASFSDFNLVLDEITWTQNSSISLMHDVNGVRITNSDLSAPDATSTLRRPGITGVSYAGTYVATASNRAGSSSTTFTAIVTAAPVILTTEIPQTYTFDENSENNLVCAATGIPAAVIYWQFEGVDIAESDPSVMITNSFAIISDLVLTTGYLTITSVQRFNAGMYTCVGTNGIGSNASFDSIVIVNYPPSIISPPAGVEAVYEDTVELSCTAEGLPVPNIMWLVEPYGGGVLMDVVMNTNIRDDTNTTHITSFLTLLSVNPIDTANYTCNASNYLGVETEKAFVEVLAEVELSFPGMPMNVTVNDTDPVDILCSARGSPAPTFMWYIGEEEASPSLISSAPSGDVPNFIYINSTLSISSATPDNSSIYTCIASNSIYGVEVNDSEQYMLVVNFAPVIQQDPTGVSVLAPNPVTLMCTARGEPSPQIVWIKETNGMEERLNATTAYSASMATSTLTIDSTDALDTANYSCMAQNLIGSARSQTAEVTVFVTPSVEAAQPLYIAIEFQVQVLTCIATGVPAPTISFVREGVILDRMGNTSFDGSISERVNLGQQTQPTLNRDGLYMVNRTLQILYPVGQDTGNFTCTASVTIAELNETLTDEDTLEVIVQTVPVIEVAPVDVVILSPGTATFFCEASGVLTPSITWRMNEDTLESGSGDIIITIDTGDAIRNNTLQVLNTLPNDTATYTCVATNDAGNDSASAELTVNFAPTITDPPLETVLTVNEGMPATFECTATGIPGPDITWRRDSDSSEFNSTLDSRVTLGMQTTPVPVSTSVGTIFSVSRQLTLSKTEDSDSGLYFCQASNGEADNLNVDVPFVLFVRVAPVIMAAPEDRTEIQGDSALFTCNATARPRPNIMWWRADSHGSIDQVTNEINKIVIEFEPFGVERERMSTLMILDVQPSDAGMYWCRAENQAGRVEENATLTVHVIPDILFPTANYQYTTNEFVDIIFECNATGIPAPNIQFFLGDTVLNSQFNERYSLPDAMMETVDISGGGDLVFLVTRQLLINTALDADSNNYSCVATNQDIRQPNDSVGFELIVRVALVIEQDPTGVSVLAPNPVTLMCTARGDPSPQIVWIKETNGMEERLNATTAYSASMSISTLTIDPTDALDTANYSCTAQNLIGSARSQAAEVTVFVTPSVEAAQPLYIAIEFQVQVLTCIATGVPAPTIGFVREGVILDRMGNTSFDGSISERVNLGQQTQPTLNRDSLYMVNRTLQILYPVGQDTGYFTCTASVTIAELNETLTDEDTFEVIVQTTPVIEVAPVDVVVLSPETATFFCEASGVLTPNITWMMNEETVESGSGDIIITIDTGDAIRRSTLQVLNTLPNDTATYTCVAINDAGNDSASAELTVNFAPTITDPPFETVVTVNEGMPATFKCTATGIPGPDITWRRDSDSSEFNSTLDSRVTLGMQTTPVPVSTSVGTIFSVSRQLTLSNTEDSDSGLYFCQASNGEADNLNVDVPFVLFVRVAPVIMAAPEDRTEIQGDSALFTCNATARPRPNIMWWRADSDGSIDQVTNEINKIVIESEPFGVERERMSTLMILDVQPSDAGVYLCRAENQAGRVEENATLTVHVIPDILFPTVNYQYITNQFMDIIFECNATGIPAPNIQFFLGDTVLNSQFNERYSLPDAMMETVDISGRGDLGVFLVTQQLLIKTALDADSNNYSCVATNQNIRQPNDSVGFELIVRVAPNVTDGPNTQTVLENEQVAFSCVAEGKPPPMIAWLQQSTDQISAEVIEQGGSVMIDTMQRGARQTVSNLTLRFALPRDAVQYICYATNIAGSDIQSANLIVHVLPSILFLEPSPLLTVNQSDSATFECNATGIPAPTIRWFMGTEQLTVAGSGEMMLNLESLTSRIEITEPEGNYYLAPGGYVFSVASVLMITSTISSDSGEYSCDVFNVVGTSMTQVEDNETTNLFVQVPPLVMPVVSEVIGNESMSATLQFRIDNAAPPVLLSGLRWFYSDNVASNISDVRVEEITNLTNRTSDSQFMTAFSSDGTYFNLTVVNIVRERLGGEDTDEGRYFLRATNPAGISVAFIDLVVYGPPRIFSVPSDKFVVDGGMSVFVCTALAFPIHYVEWIFTNNDGDSSVVISTNEPNNTKYRINRIISTLSFGQLIIVDVQYSDRGQYMCRAINEIGVDTAAANLTVHVPPIVEAASPEMQINVSEPAILVCLITGFPLPSIAWQKSGEDLSADFTQINITEFEVNGIESGGGRIADLLRETEFSEEEIQALGELGVVTIVTFNALERSDTGEYMCTATNSLPGEETGVLMAIPPTILLTVLEVPDAPTNFTTGAFGSRWVSLEWMLGFGGNSDLLSLLVRVTRQRMVELRVLEIAVTSQDINRYNVTEGILPFITYEFQVSVCNTIGCGRFTETVTVMTEQDAPDEAPAITESVSPTSTSLRISWSAPAANKHNGILIDYVIFYTNDDELPVSMWERISAPNTTITLTDLSIFTEYTVSVAAATVAGVGPDVSVAVRTLSDTCSEPLGLTFTDVGETTLALEWSESAIPNGIIDNYTISYAIEDSADSVNRVSSETESVRLVNLEPFTEYTVTVTCVNAAGPGNSSSPMKRRTSELSTAFFQLRLLGISDCVQWKEIDSAEKKEGLLIGVTRALDEICQCGFSREAFHDIDITAGFQCFDESPTAVTFRGEIGAALTANSSQLISYLEQWVATNPTIVIQSSRLSIDSSCNVAIDNFNDPECNDIISPVNDDSTNTGAIIGGVVGGVFVMLIVAVAVKVVASFVRTQRKKASYKLDKEDVIYDYPMFPLKSTSDAHVPTEENLAYSVPTTSVHIATEDNLAYGRHITSTVPPALPQPLSTIYTNIAPVQDRSTTTTSDSRPPAPLPSTASTADATQRPSTGSTDPPMPLPEVEKQGSESEDS